MGYRMVIAVLASFVAGALAAAPAGAHDDVSSAAGHAAEDAVVHTAAQERALGAHTRAVTAADAMTRRGCRGRRSAGRG